MASGILCGLVIFGRSPLVNAEHTHSTGDLRLTVANMASGRSVQKPPHCLINAVVQWASALTEDAEESILRMAVY